MKGGISVERLSAAAEDCNACARIHRAEIPHGFLPQLGSRVLEQLYATIATSPSGFVFIARDDTGSVLGFIAGSENTKRLYREFFRRAGTSIMWPLLRRLVSPRRVMRLAETLLYPSRVELADLPAAEILNFCVSRDAQGTGVGRALFQALVGEFARRGVHNIRIVTGVDQLSAQRFYASAGAALAGQISVHSGSPELIYVYPVINHASPETAPK